MRTLKVCHSRDLPAVRNRDPKYIYFVYNMLEIFMGQNLFTDPYIVCDSDPVNPLAGMMYINSTDGSIKVLGDGTLVTIAEIEDSSQIPLLREQGGSYFFVNADKRYLDLQTRTITLPYRNGQYDLTVSAASNIKIDADTVVAFNPETQCFDIVGKKEDYDLVFTRSYRGGETKSATTTVDDGMIKTDVKISAEPGNLIRMVDDGLSAVVKDKVTATEFNNWRSNFQEYKAAMEAFMLDLDQRVTDAEIDISEEFIISKIHEALEVVYPDIDEALEKIDDLAERLNQMRRDVMQYTDTEFDMKVAELEEWCQQSPWGEITET